MNTTNYISSDSLVSDLADYESKVSDYFSLLKPRVMSLVVFIGFCGMLIAPSTIHPFISLIAILCIALGSGAAGCINMWYDRDIDNIMNRTKTRPIPMGKILPASALEFGIATAFLSVFTMAFAVNFVAAFWLAFAILFYVFIYTMWLKRSTPQNIVIGGAAGAFPPVIGWNAVSTEFSLFPWILFAIIFFWTCPHFWALALCKSDDYKRANIPMLPVIKGQESTLNHIIFYTILLFISSLLPYMLNYTGFLYYISSLILGMIFLYKAIMLKKEYSDKKAMLLFGYSIIYLFILFLVLIFDYYIGK